MKKALLSLLLAHSLGAVAQHSEQPQKESSLDLRNVSTIFSIDGNDKSYFLERTSNLEYFLRAREGSREDIRKVSSKEAQKLDRDFARHFLRCQYEIEGIPGNCEV